jgi:predicted nucleic acid-binding protein
MILLLDSNVIIDVLRGRGERRRKLAALVELGHLPATSSLNIAEIYAGIRAGEGPRTTAFLDSLRCFPITKSIARLAGTLKAQWAAKGQTLALDDMLVAATALEHNLPLITDNHKHFPVHGLRFYPLT